jgi:hypothetical protein
MKAFVSFIIAAILYIVVGLIAWNIVCSIIDYPSMTLIELADYRIYTYSAIPMIIYFIAFLFIGGDEGALGFVGFLLALNAGVAIATNHWEGMWPSVGLIFTIIYNLVNVIFISFVVRMCFNDNK